MLRLLYPLVQKLRSVYWGTVKYGNGTAPDIITYDSTVSLHIGKYCSFADGAAVMLTRFASYLASGQAVP